jgi:hypothetical protein
MTCPCNCATFADHIRGIQFQGIKAMENRASEKAMIEDRGAYERLRKNGIRPGKYRGARNLERAAEIPQEVQMGMILPKDLKTALKNGDGEIVGLGGKT